MYLVYTIMLLISSVLSANDMYEEKMKKMTDEWRKVDVFTMIFLLQTEKYFFIWKLSFFVRIYRILASFYEKSIKVV